jgi:hypothetical protein
MKRNILFFAMGILLMNIFSSRASAQSAGQVYSNNVALLSEKLFGSFGAGNLAYWRNPATDSTYILTSMDWGLDIINVTSPSSPQDEVQINESGHVRGDLSKPNLSVEDVSVYQGSGDAYAYLARAVTGINPYIIVIDINAALAHGGTYLITPGSPDGTIYVSDIHNPNTSNQGFVGWQAHTLNIAGGILYVATQTHNIGVYSLATASQPALMDSLVMPASPNTAAPYSDQTVHQIVARSTGSNTATLYVADTRGGIRVVNM